MRLRSPDLALPWKRLFAEFGVIFAGVLIALAVDSWSERRQERQQAESYLNQLLVDFQETERRLQSTIRADEQTLGWVNSVIARTFQGAFPSADSLDLPTGYSQFRPLTGTLVALVQGGDLRLLHSDSVRLELVAFAALLDATETTLRHTEELIWNSTERVILGRARHSQSATRRSVNGRRGWGDVDVVGVLTDPEIISALQVQAAASENRLRNLRRLEAPIGRILTLLSAVSRS
jgi:hypothetical protein